MTRSPEPVIRWAAPFVCLTEVIMQSNAVWGLLLLSYGLAGCTPALPPSAFADNGPEMRPEAFFAGTTASSGVIEDRAGAPTGRFHVEGTGAALPDGDFRLVQRITFDHDTPRTRTWV